MTGVEHRHCIADRDERVHSIAVQSVCHAVGSRARVTCPASRSSLLLGWGFALLLQACTSEPPSMVDAGPAAAPSTLVVLPDTQFYACAYPQIFDEQAQWVVDHARSDGLAAVLHTGDIVDSDTRAQWEIASRSLHRLDGVLPYLVTAGNHDLEVDRTSLIGAYFDPQAARVEVRIPGRFDDAFTVVEIAGQPWLLLGLEFGPRDAAVAWADAVLSAHADLPAVLFTHAYLYRDGERYDRAIVPPQPYHPDSYQFTPEQGINDGEDLFRKLVEVHENVHLVLSGHVIPHGTGRSVVVRPSGTRVHEVLANYQLCDLCPCAQVEGGGGYLRLLRFDPDGSAIHVTTYSPHKQAFLHDSENEFTLDL